MLRGPHLAQFPAKTDSGESRWMKWYPSAMTEYGFGFGIVLPKHKLVDIVCSKYKKIDKDTFDCIFLPDVEEQEDGPVEYLDMADSGVKIGPLQVYERDGAGVCIEFCGAWMKNTVISEKKLLACLKKVQDLKKRGLIPKKAKAGVYHWWED